MMDSIVDENKITFNELEKKIPPVRLKNHDKAEIGHARVVNGQEVQRRDRE